MISTRVDFQKINVFDSRNNTLAARRQCAIINSAELMMAQQFKIDNYNLNYIDEGRGPVMVFVHGTPVSSAEFADVIAKVKLQFRCIAIDHLGFGDSDKPKNADYSLSAHRQRWAALLKHLNVDKFHLVVTDFGGPIALPWATDNWNKVESLTMMNTWGWYLPETQPELQKMKWLMNSWLMKIAYLYLNFSAKVILKQAWGTHKLLSSERHHYYQSRFKKASERMGTLGFLKALFKADDTSWTVGAKLAQMPAKPTLIIWGTADNFIAKANLKRWQELLPKARVQTLEKVGHFVSEEAPELVAIELLKNV